MFKVNAYFRNNRSPQFNVTATDLRRFVNDFKLFIYDFKSNFYSTDFILKDNCILMS